MEKSFDNKRLNFIVTRNNEIFSGFIFLYVKFSKDKLKK